MVGEWKTMDNGRQMMHKNIWIYYKIHIPCYSCAQNNFHLIHLIAAFNVENSELHKNSFYLLLYIFDMI